MSDALNQAIRDRQNRDKAMAAGEEPSVSVYVVKIANKTLDNAYVIGAVYWEEADAQAEVQRLNAANSYTRASYMRRYLPEKKAATRVGWGQE